MLMTPTSSSCILCILAAKLFPPLLFFPSLKGQHTSLTQLRGIKHSCPDVQRESGPAMEATTVLGRVTSTAPRERNMYRRPVLLPSPRRNIRRRLIAGTRMIPLSITYSSLLLSFRDFYGKDRNIISISFCFFFFSYESEKKSFILYFPNYRIFNNPVSTRRDGILRLESLENLGSVEQQSSS